MQKKKTQPAKLAKPRLHRAIERTRLFAMLDAYRERRSVMIVTGPPGAGKTSTVASWLDSRKVRTLWLQLDASDADLATFFHFMKLAAEPFARKNHQPLPAFTAEYLSDIEGFSRRFFRELASRLPDETVVVLDNFQEIPTTDALHALLVDAFLDTSENLQWVVVSRADLPPVYARLFVTERVDVLSWSALRLTQDEAQKIALSRGCDLREAVELFRQSGGWSAGLTLLIEGSLAGRADTEIAKLESRDRIFDYFATQVYESLPAITRDVLLQAALMPAIVPSILCAVTDVADAGERIEDLYRRRLFVDRRGRLDRSYLLHPLFREFLLQRGCSQWSHARRLETRRGVAEHLRRSSADREDAISLYQDNQDWNAVAEIVLEIASELLAQGRWKRLLEYIAVVPAGLVADSPWLLYWHGMASINANLHEARECLTSAAHGFESKGMIFGDMLASAGVIRTYHFEYNTFQPMDLWVERIERLLASKPNFPSAGGELAVFGALLVAITYRLPHHPLRSVVAGRLVELIAEPVDANQRVSAAIALLIYCAFSHEFETGATVLELISTQVEFREVSALNQVTWWMFVGYFHHRSADRLRADEALTRSDVIAQEHGLRNMHFIGRCFRAYHAASWGESQQAREALRGLERQLDPSKPMLAAQYHNARCFLAMAEGNAQESEQQARLGVAAARRLGAPFFMVAWLSIGSAALAMNGACTDAEAWIDEGWMASEGSFLETYRPAMQGMRAFVSLRRGEVTQCHRQLRELLDAKASASSLSFFRTAPAIKEIILPIALRIGAGVPLVQNLIEAWQIEPPAEDVPGWPWPVRVLALGEFRVEVGGAPLSFGRKLPRRPLALLKALVAWGGRSVPVQWIMDNLWPDEDGDRAASACTAAIHRLRKLLRHDDALCVASGLLSLNPRVCWVDSWSVARLVGNPVTEGHRDQVAPEEVLRLYKGPFLSGDTDDFLVGSVREDLRSAVTRYLMDAGMRRESSGESELALELYRRAQAADVLVEGFYQGEMRCLKSLGRFPEALACFGRLEQSLALVRGQVPSRSSWQLREQIVRLAESVTNR